MANTRSILAMACQYSGNFERAIELFGQTIDDYTDIVESNPSAQSTRLLIVGGQTRQDSLSRRCLPTQWQKAQDSISEAQMVLAGLEATDSMRGLVSEYRSHLRISDEILKRIRGEKPDTETTTGQCLALLWIARTNAANSVSFILSDPCRNSVSKVAPDFVGNQFEDLFAFVNSLDEPIGTQFQTALV